ncbi:hypothetical protein BAY59_10985 [Prauserella coralliicola]|nr:hypothetical protein BAY59_10985 [Prauserella coralliicola]
MARPPLEIGTYGEIKVTELPNGKHEAHARFRMSDGSVKQVRRRGKTKTAATNALKKAMVRLADEVKGEEISPDTRFNHVADLYLAELRDQAELGEISHNSVRLYTGALKNWTRPMLGELQMRELTGTRCDKVVNNARTKNSYATAKTVKAALAGVCAYGLRHGALSTNPMGAVRRMSSGPGEEVVALTAEQREDMYAKLKAYGEVRQTDSKGRSLGERGRVWLDLPDIMDAMLATGNRIGELLALEGASVDPQAPTVLLDHHIVRITGRGLVRQRRRKSKGRDLLLAVPQWSVPMWRRRKLASGGGPLFQSFTGGWLDPSNVINALKQAFEATGYGWVTSHVWRKTVASVLDEAGLPTTAIADQLGNTPAVVEKHYRAARVANQAAATALEIMRRPDQEDE